MSLQFPLSLHVDLRGADIGHAFGPGLSCVSSMPLSMMAILTPAPPFAMPPGSACHAAGTFTRQLPTRSRGARTNTAFNKVCADQPTRILWRANSPRSCRCALSTRARPAVCRAKGGSRGISAYSPRRFGAKAGTEKSGRAKRSRTTACWTQPDNRRPGGNPRSSVFIGGEYRCVPPRIDTSHESCVLAAAGRGWPILAELKPGNTPHLHTATSRRPGMAQ